MCNYREEFVFKPISSQFNIVVGCNLSFTRFLNASYLSNGWIIFIRLNAIKEFATSFLCWTLHAINLLLSKKILSLAFFKTITISRPITFQIFPYRDIRMSYWGRVLKRGCPWNTKSLNFALLLDMTPVPLSFPDHRPHIYIEKKGSSNSF